ncbi:phospholipase A2 [Pleuronectes platessa]|uniref:phospholipase A2 n=1 Tax=Pleuronectes platessa TaxID=8262 RepID=UPI00232A677A|nr:phospholipase A2 [Pleuronectes platessa]
MNALRTLFLLAAGLSVGSYMLVQFYDQIKCKLPDSPPIKDYADYGCYCGYGGSGTPVDDLDRCCQVHDKCYGDAMEHDQCRSIIDSPYFKLYSYNCDVAEEKITCAKNNSVCEQFICECDRKAAECFAKSTYNPENKRLPSERCQ